MNKDVKFDEKLTDKELALGIGQLAEDLFGEDVRVIDIQNESEVVDYLILLTGNSSTQVKGMANNIDKSVRTVRERFGMEGRVEDTDWILLDYGTIVVHIFDSAARMYYNLDELWKGNLLTWAEIKKRKVK